jgi:HD-like signal output (HDOD) protein
MNTLLDAKSETLDEAVAAIAASDGELPMLPEVAAQLLKLTSDIDCEAADIVALIKRDQSLTSHLLRTANSPRYNTGVTISSIQQAVARLGLNSVREIVVLISCQCRIFNVGGFEADVRESFRISLAAAAFSQEIARVRRMNVEDAFLGGLLHDVGRPILLQALSDRRRGAGLRAADDELRKASDEHRVPLAAQLITAWDLPERVAEAVRFQQSPQDSAQCTQQAASLCLAIELAKQLLNPNNSDSQKIADHPMVAILSLYPEQLTGILRHRETILKWVDSTL